jgi:nucleoside-triphosphatase THEP1
MPTPALRTSRSTAPPPSDDPGALVPARGRPPVQLPREPWSVIGPDFIRSWSKDEKGGYQPEHLEILGQSGSGKSFWLTQVLVVMARLRKSAIVYIATKQADRTIAQLGWPVTDSIREVDQHDQVVFWPRTSRTGRARRAYQAAKVEELLDHLWQADANVVVVFDEIATIAALSPEVRALVEMYLREGRSHGIVCVMGKQRGQKILPDMHSESSWIVVFHLKTLTDMEYAAGLLGGKTEWIPVLESLSKDDHEFVIQHSAGDEQYISWIDRPVDVRAVSKSSSGYRR